MDDLVAVEVGDRVGDVADEPPALAVIDVPAEPLERAGLPEAVEILVGMQAHRVVGRIVEQIKVVQRHDALMLRHLGELLELSRHRCEIDRTGAEDLQRPLRDPAIGRAKDLAIRAFPQRGLVDHVVLNFDGIFFVHDRLKRLNSKRAKS